jgi:2-iminoacetate synthase
MRQKTTTERSPLSFIELRYWVRDNDPDAEHRLPILDRARQLLASDPCRSLAARRAHADKIERWRYQVLNHYGSRLSCAYSRVCDALDLLAQDLAGRPVRRPRAPRSVIDPSGSLPIKLACEHPGVDLDLAAAFLQPNWPLDDLAERATALTIDIFGTGSSFTDGRDPESLAPGMGRQIRLYAPLYLSNYCINHCLYCFFRYPNALERVQLTKEESLRQAEILRQHGFHHILLVAGDYPKLTRAEYFCDIAAALARDGFCVGIEIAPQSTKSYAALSAAGVVSVTLYQETYHELAYVRYHPRGAKSWFDWRLEAHERALDAGVRRLGLGILLGLHDPAQDLLMMIRHARYLRARFAQAQLAFSLPRIHAAPSGFVPAHRVSDDEFTRLYCVLRLAFPDAPLVLSTRERPALRERLTRLCVTQLSAGSVTSPGGYGAETSAGTARQQFPVADHRTPAEIVRWLAADGFRVGWDGEG